MRQLTTPFDASIELDTVRALFDEEKLEIIGNPLDGYRDSIMDSLEDLATDPAGNPASTAVESRLRGAFEDKLDLRVYCDAGSRNCWQALLPDLTDGNFLCSPSQYRASSRFDVLFKFGPLRASGWGAVPDGILSAPRFKRLVQFVWEGSQSMCDNIGFDPAWSGNSDVKNCYSGVVWNVSETLCGLGAMANDHPQPTIDDGPDEDLDDFQFVTKIRGGRNTDLADLVGRTLIRLAPGLAKFVSPVGRVMVLNREGVAEVLPGDSINNFLIQSSSDGTNLGGAQHMLGDCGSIWKAALSDLLNRRGRTDVARELRNLGLNLITLENRLPEWTREDGINAPGQRRHFDILLDCLENQGVVAFGKYFRERAWGQVRKARGQAIIEGRDWQELVVSEIERFVERNLAIILGELDEADYCTFPLPPDSGMGRNLDFFRVVGVEDGYLVPRDFDHTIIRESEVDQWRE